LLTAVRVTIERRDLKGGLQEVPKVDNWPKRQFFFPGNCLFAPERHLCPGAIKKGYKNPISSLTNGTTGFCAPIIFSFLQIKSF
jgi:hypothetical protein